MFDIGSTINSPQAKKAFFSSMAIVMLKDVAIKIASFAANKFLEQEKIPIKMNYVDRWPAFCQKSRKIGATFWARRTEAAVASSTTFAAILASLYAAVMYPQARKPYDLACQATAYLLNKVSSGWKATDEMMPVFSTAIMAPIVGAATNVCLGAYDLYHKKTQQKTFPLIKPIFNASLQGELDEIIRDTQARKKEGGYFENLILYGPPGTGKTLASKYIAEQSGMNYAFTSGGKLVTNEVKNKEEIIDPVEGLTKFLDHAKNLSTPTVIFVDEAEVFCASRETLKKNPKASALLTAFLGFTSDPSPNIMWVLATNRIKDFDPAVLDRFRTLLVDLPGLPEREKITETTIPIVWPNNKKRPTVAREVVQHIAKQTTKFSGRNLFQLLNKTRFLVQPGKPLTTQHIDKAIGKMRIEADQALRAGG